MLDSRQMNEKGYSKAFRLCFDFLARYADAVNEDATWERCCMEIVELSRQYENSLLSPLVNGLLAAVFDEVTRVHTTEESPVKSPQRTEKKGYRFTLL